MAKLKETAHQVNIATITAAVTQDAQNLDYLATQEMGKEILKATA